MSTQENTQKPSHLWQPGQSGNPNGRPKGSKNKITLLKQVLEAELREASKSKMPEVMAKALELALQGDRSMIKLLLELHMSKGYLPDEKAAEKVEINISTAAPAETKKPSAEEQAEQITKELSNV